MCFSLDPESDDNILTWIPAEIVVSYNSDIFPYRLSSHYSTLVERVCFSNDDSSLNTLRSIEESEIG